jgi:hypothetical protein
MFNLHATKPLHVIVAIGSLRSFSSPMEEFRSSSPRAVPLALFCSAKWPPRPFPFGNSRRQNRPGC